MIPVTRHWSASSEGRAARPRAPPSVGFLDGGLSRPVRPDCTPTFPYIILSRSPIQTTRMRPFRPISMYIHASRPSQTTSPQLPGKETTRSSQPAPDNDAGIDLSPFGLSWSSACHGAWGGRPTTTSFRRWPDKSDGRGGLMYRTFFSLVRRCASRRAPLARVP
jgi:hypothetical protein